MKRLIMEFVQTSFHTSPQCYNYISTCSWRSCSYTIACKIVDAWWRHQRETFSALLALCAKNSPVPGEFPHKGQWRGALMFSLICVWINGWVNNREAGDLRRYRAHYGVTVMARITQYNARNTMSHRGHFYDVPPHGVRILTCAL